MLDKEDQITQTFLRWVYYDKYIKGNGVPIALALWVVLSIVVTLNGGEVEIDATTAVPLVVGL